MRRHRWWSAIAAVCLVAATMGINAAPAHAEPTWWRYITFNVKGSSPASDPPINNGQLWSVIELGNFVQARIDQGLAPLAVALQEVCYDNDSSPTYSQYNWLAEFFQARGFHGKFGFAESLPATPYTNCGSYGNAIFTWGNAVHTDDDDWLMPAGSIDFPNANESRNLVCLGQWLFGLVVYHACSTHLDNSSTAYSQVSYVFAKLRYDFQIPSQYVMASIGGDFNVRYSQAGDDNDMLEHPAYPWYDYAEGGASTPTAGSNKIDYQWVRRNNLTNPVLTIHGVAPMARSDHKLLETGFVRP